MGVYTQSEDFDYCLFLAVVLNDGDEDERGRY
jgi:hypothetical protein